MRVLHVMSQVDPRHGGPVMALDVLARAQAAQGALVTVAATYCAGSDVSVVDGMEADGVRTVLIGPSRSAMDRHPSLSGAVSDLVRESDVVHIHGLWQEIQHRAARSAQRSGVPYIIRTCGMLSPWSLSQSAVKKRAYLQWRLKRNLREASALHFTADSEREAAGRLGVLAPSIIEPNGLDLDQYRVPLSGVRFREQHGIGLGRPLVLFLGRLHQKKGIDLLIPAVERVVATVPDIALVIAGPDEDGYRADLEGQVQRAGLQDRVTFTGPLDRAESRSALAAADLFVLPSRDENFAVAAIESLAMGSPVIVSDRVGVHRAIRQGEVGAVVPLDVNPLAREIERWLTDHKLRNDAAARARSFAQEHFDARSVAGRWLAHYSRLIGPSTTTSRPQEAALGHKRP